MNISMLKGKIHRATVVQAELNYVGSITVDPVLMEAAGILQEGTSSVEIDLDAQTAFLKEKGTNVDEMDEQEIREADTEDKVFLKATVKVLDAIEEVSLNVAV